MLSLNISIILHRGLLMDWKNLEDYVRQIASSIWDSTAMSRTIDGVQIDCVVEKENDYWCLVEVTKEYDLQKVRDDIIKLNSVGCGLASKGIYTKKFIVLEKTPTSSMRSTGLASHITVLSIEEFEKEWFDYGKYVFKRTKYAFGSVVNIETGCPENGVYVPVTYKDINANKTYTVDDIAKKLINGSRIVLKGSFGTGKSSCVKQLFDVLSKEYYKSRIYTLALNLREHWGAKSYRELIQRHFEDLGINPDSYRKVTNKDGVIFLLDGFDEIGSQSWSIDPNKIQNVRARAVLPVKDLLKNTRGGCIITGREHYFNTDKEMLDCLGLPQNTLILECAEEFEEAQIKQYITKNIDSAVTYLPKWLPKRPLIMSIALHNAGHIFDEENAIENEYDFWDVFFTLLSKREANISVALNDETIKQIMIMVARISRFKDKDFGPITLNDLNYAYERVTGDRPNEESAIMLHRLPGLGRIDADSNDRTFVDSYILNGLRAEDIIQLVSNGEQTAYEEKWVNCLNVEGNNILSSYLDYDSGKVKDFLTAAVLCGKKNNSILLADIVAAISKCICINMIDFKNIAIRKAYMPYLDFSNKTIKNIQFDNVLIHELDLTSVNLEGVIFYNCDIDRLIGVSSGKSLGDVLHKCEVKEYQLVSTVNRIKRAKLTRAQIILVTIIKKIFSTVNKGNGRKEEALLRGLGDKSDSKICDKIINKMLTDELITKHKGKEGWVYSPILKHTSRMIKILEDLTNSQDELWTFATELNEK